MRLIPFFSDQIEIQVHTATHAKHVGKTIKLADFADGQPITLSELENGELRATRGGYPNIEFIDGPEACSDSKTANRSRYRGRVKSLCAFYGFTACPLSDSELDTLADTGATIDEAYSVACDVNAGFSFSQSAKTLTA